MTRLNPSYTRLSLTNDSILASTWKNSNYNTIPILQISLFGPNGSTNEGDIALLLPGSYCSI